MDSEMAPELWSRLPHEIQDHLLTFLTVPVLCRFRKVCKRWDSLVRSDSEFRALRIKHANAHGYILGREARGLPYSTALWSESIEWRLLDVKENRWYYLKHKEVDCIESRSLNVDGGLACAHYFDPMTLLPTVCVSNPIAKVLARLPGSPYAEMAAAHLSWQALQRPGNPRNRNRAPFLMSMVVEHGEIFERYKIFQMCSRLHEEVNSTIPCIVVYDSTTDSWQRSSANLAGQTEVYTHQAYHRHARLIIVRCIVIFQAFLYALITQKTPLDINGFWELWRFCPDEDAWTNVTSAKKPMHAFFQMVYPQLIVSDDRLFLVTWVSRSDVTTFELIEILLKDGHWRLLVQIPKRQMEEIFETNFYERQNGPGTVSRYNDHSLPNPLMSLPLDSRNRSC